MGEAMVHRLAPGVLVTLVEDAQGHPGWSSQEPPVEILQIFPRSFITWGSGPANLALSNHPVWCLTSSVVQDLQRNLKN